MTDDSRHTQAARVTAPPIRGVFVVLAVASVLVALGLYRVWSEYQVFEAGSVLRSQSAEHQALVDEHRRLELEVATLEHSLDVERRARDELQMRTADDRELVIVRDMRTAQRQLDGETKSRPGVASGPKAAGPNEPTTPSLGAMEE